MATLDQDDLDAIAGLIAAANLATYAQINDGVRPILADVDAEKIAAAEGVKRATNAVRGAVK